MSKKSMNTKGRASAVRAWLPLAVSVALVACSGGNNSSNPTPTSLATIPVFNSVSATQGTNAIIALDPVNQVIWVPSYTLDANGNLQYRLISTAALVAGGDSAVSKSVSLDGCDTPLGIAFIAATGSAAAGSVLVECTNSVSNALVVVSIDATSLAVTPVPTPGLSYSGDNGGGIVYDPNGQAFIVASQTAGLIQVPADGPPTFNTNSLTALSNSPYSLAMNFVTQQVSLTFYRYQSILIDASTVNPPPTGGLNTVATLDYPQYVNGATFDSATDILTVSNGTLGNYYDTDTAYVFTDPASGNGPSETVIGFLDYLGGLIKDNGSNGAGGLAALNATTHQTLIADTWGPNLFLMQQPSTPPLDLDNNGQPSPSGTPSPIPPDGNSTYAIAQMAIPFVNIAGVSTQLDVVGGPTGLVIDSANNVAFVLADTDYYAGHPWTQNFSNSIPGLSLYLVAVDLSAPVQNACAVLCPTPWNPLTAEVNIP